RENRNDPAEWYVLLREARDLSVKAERPRLALEAIHEMDEWFVIDPQAMATKVLTELAKSTNETTISTVAAVALAECRRAWVADKYDAAAAFLKLAEDATGKTKDKVKDVLQS